MERVALTGVRRGLALLSLTTIPKKQRYLPTRNAWLLPHTEVLTVTVEVMNQGEVEESAVTVTLALRSSAGASSSFTQTIDRISAGAKRPVTFENVLPDTAPGSRNYLNVEVSMVEGEAFPENNVKELVFLLGEG